MDVISATTNKHITYEQRNINKREPLREQQGHIIKDDNYFRQLPSNAPVYDKVNYDSYRQEYFKELNMSMTDGISGGMQKYEELYNEITKNTPEGETRDSLHKMLDKAFESSTSLYADNIASGIWALSGVKLKAEIPALGTHTMIKPDNSTFHTMNKDRKQMIDEFKNMFSNIHSFFHDNGSFLGVAEKITSSSSSSFSISDFDELSKGLMKELINSNKSGTSSDKISDQINQSNLSGSAKQLLKGIIQKQNESK